MMEMLERVLGEPEDFSLRSIQLTGPAASTSALVACEDARTFLCQRG
eukprot:CAMPEP_0180524952 /NCGR_PEP_ID=MMETSP1036_2-20121128/58902_1 /TAXON_ID=632150 /ORGANISM="Azadinium spinosum, Strain 3D9" /LENGTH=46 /DNA_ID= /DNA_START= /DNA_END= /DNA_ORIENTATION=